MSRMVPHDIFGGNFVVLPPADVLMPHAENQGSRKQGLKAEAKVLGFIVSGLLSIIMEKRTNKRMAWASLATNLLSLVTAFVGFVLITFHMATVLVAWGECELDVMPTQPHTNSYYSSESTTFKCAIASSILLGVLSGMLLFTVLEFCVAIPTSVLWWRQARSGVPGDVRFLTQRETVTINVLPETFADPDPGSEKLATSMERENEGNRERE
ncbi:membrane-spanning 4-domains subfamily A member 6A isoform X3 [Rhinolophus ferrumequinum]|uniref:Membrane spanning 4-domains A6A n=1 Tax=Rhinolophus ferrumequinum TaxID=59479 RepID=A0A671FVN8_RHIFE|nr:membrane-spanning 4-domains subfamily A member 6A isoform X3 [Rhinolophus ferrumequinum]